MGTHIIACCLTSTDSNHLRLMAAVQFRQPHGVRLPLSQDTLVAINKKKAFAALLFI